MAEKEDYFLAASIVDVGYDLWEFWNDNRLKLPHSLVRCSEKHRLSRPPPSWRECSLSSALAWTRDRHRALATALPRPLFLSTTEGGESSVVSGMSVGICFVIRMTGALELTGEKEHGGSIVKKD